MVKLTIGGVPEHFNFPWLYAIENGFFQEKRIELVWQDFGGGTGAMHQAINEEKIDLALVLTEGAVQDILRYPVKKIIQTYVNSPLQWGIHVSSMNKAKKMNDLQGKRYAISRWGSGSHLMAFVDAAQRGWQLSEEQFVLVGNLEGAKKALQNGEADIFLWERFMTQPLVDAGTFKRIDICPTPWACFVLEARQEILEKYPKTIQTLQNIIHQTTQNLMKNPLTVEFIAEKYDLALSDVETWFAQTQWATQAQISAGDIMQAQETLKKLGLIDKTEKIDFFCDMAFCQIV